MDEVVRANLGESIWTSVVLAAAYAQMGPGSRLGCYEVTAPLGEGGMGIVRP